MIRDMIREVVPEDLGLRKYNLRSILLNASDFIQLQKEEAVLDRAPMYAGVRIYKSLDTEVGEVALVFKPRMIHYSDFHREELQKVVARLRHGIAQLNKEIDDIFGGITK